MRSFLIICHGQGCGCGWWRAAVWFVDRQLIRGLDRSLRFQRYPTSLKRKVFYLIKLFPFKQCRRVASISGFAENVFVFSRRLEFRPAAVARAPHVKWRSDGSVNGRHDSLHAQFQLWYRHGVSTRSVWAFHCYGEFSPKVNEGWCFTLLRTLRAKYIKTHDVQLLVSEKMQSIHLEKVHWMFKKVTSFTSNE